MEIGNSSKWSLCLSGIDTYRFGNYMLACIGSLSDSPPNLKCPVYEFGHHMYHLTFMPVACATTLAESRSFHLGGRSELYQGKYWPDPRNFVGVEQILDPSKILSTPCPKPGFGPPVDLGNSAWVENWSKMPGSAGFWPGREFSRTRQFRLGRAESGPGQIWLDPGAHKSSDLL